MPGTLFLVATPIGNLDDISSRAVQTLRSSARIFCEDTRRTARLTTRFSIDTPRESLHGFSERKKCARVLSLLDSGETISLVSDAGTPVISDPGRIIVRDVLAAGHRVSPIPGPSAAAAAFSCAGTLSDSFLFAGFLPSTGKKRTDELDLALSRGLPVIFYEAPTRITALLELLRERNARIVVCRELTKQHEEIFRYDRSGAITEKGEFTVVAEPAPVTPDEDPVDPTVLRLLRKYNMTGKDMLAILRRLHPDKRKSELKKLLFP